MFWGSSSRAFSVSRWTASQSGGDFNLWHIALLTQRTTHDGSIVSASVYLSIAALKKFLANAVLPSALSASASARGCMLGA